MFTEDYREIEKYHQYILHSRELYLIERYNFDTLPLRIINRALALAVDETLHKYNVEVISDVPFGKGFLHMRARLLELLEQSKEKIEKV